MSLESDAEEIMGLAQELSKQKVYADQLGGKEKGNIKAHMADLLERMDKASQRIIVECEDESEVPEVKEPARFKQELKKPEKFYLSKGTRRRKKKPIS